METFSVNVDVTTCGVVEANVSLRVWFWLAMHSVFALTLTISFWWIGKFVKSNEIKFDINPLNSITFYEYNNDPNVTPEVDADIEL